MTSGTQAGRSAGAAAAAGDASRHERGASSATAELGTPRAQLAAWGLLAVLQLVVVAVWAPSAVKTPVAVRLFFDAGALLAAGFVTMGVAATWQRLRPETRRWARWPATAAVGAIWAALFGDDLLGAVSWLPGPVPVYAGLAAAVAGATLPWAAALAERLARRAWARPLLVAAGVLLSAVNGFVLVTGYEGIHLWILFLAAALVGGALAVTRFPTAAPAATWAADAALALIAAAAVTLPPSPGVLGVTLRWPGSAFAPFLARVRGGAACGDAGMRAAQTSPWFQPNRPAQPPMSPPLLTGDRIVLLFTIDALRADVLADDRHQPKLPNLFSLRDRSVWFTNARATSPATAPSIASIMTGKYYSQIYWTNQAIGKKLKYSPHEDTSVGFPKLLADAGVTTVHLATPEGATQETGVVRGFAEEVVFGRSAAEYPAELRKRLEAFSGGRLFVYGHFIEPHHPYKAAGATPFDKYLGEVALVDAALGAILADVDRLGLADRTVIMVTADHGEAFGEHGTQFHSLTLYDELLRVPLLVRVPSVAARRVEAMASIIDLGPTVLDVFEQPTPGDFLGASLLPLVRGGASPPTRPIAAESGRRMQAMIFDDGTKVIEDLRHRSVAVYDLSRDPQELDNLGDGGPELVCRQNALLRAFFDTHTLRRPGYEPPYRP
jgi:hypothetical protein